MKPWTPETLAKEWGMSPQTIRNLVNSGALKAFRTKRLIRILPEWAEEFQKCGGVSEPIEESGASSSDQTENAEGSPPDSTPQPRTVKLPNGRRLTLYDN